MIGAEAFGKMRRDAYFINTSRGDAVDEDALYGACNSRRIAGAALDVFKIEPQTDSKLAKLDNIYLTPHIGASTREAQEDRIPRELIQRIRNEVDARKLKGRLREDGNLHIAGPRQSILTPAPGTLTAAIVGGHAPHFSGNGSKRPRPV